MDMPWRISKNISSELKPSDVKSGPVFRSQSTDAVNIPWDVSSEAVRMSKTTLLSAGSLSTSLVASNTLP